jgi:hypothetical protein
MASIKVADEAATRRAGKAVQMSVVGQERRCSPRRLMTAAPSTAEMAVRSPSVTLTALARKEILRSRLKP